MSAQQKRSRIGVIDIFAGPGGLGEGFSTFEPTPGQRPFTVAVSAEKEPSAHETLRLRALSRLLKNRDEGTSRDYLQYLSAVVRNNAIPPDAYFGEGPHKDLWEQACHQALQLTLGEEKDNQLLYERIKEAKRTFDELVLVGGPPCQAYSLVGRVKNRRLKGYRAKEDSRHYLYRQYLQILAEFKPAIFILENVKGILTSKVGATEMFPAISHDLSDPNAALGKSAGSGSSRYVLLPVHMDGGLRTPERVADDPYGFMIRCEQHGIAQARHRVVIMGIRENFAYGGIAQQPGLKVVPSIPISTALAGLPPLRSGLSRRPDDPSDWKEAMEDQRRYLSKILRTNHTDVARKLTDVSPAYNLPRIGTKYTARPNTFVKKLRCKEQKVVLNHETRGHMPSDLGRYLFCATFAQVRSHSPNSRDFPIDLAPNHISWWSGAFADRFRLQVEDEPSSTVTSHLSKDGHAFIHWDPAQCRSLTVREAARLQSFPDDYLFLGNRTQQYVQVGNAVPPLVAQQIAGVVWGILDGKP